LGELEAQASNPLQRQIFTCVLVAMVDPFKINGKQAKSIFCLISSTVSNIPPNHLQLFGHENQSTDSSCFINEAITQVMSDFPTLNKIIVVDSKTYFDLSIVKRYCVYVSGKLKGRMTASFIFC
jgi:hypothetical protein